MIRRLRTLQWNIGGGYIQSTTPQVYDCDGLAYIEHFIKEQAPDIVTLQETHSKNGKIQANILAQGLGWTSVTHDVYAHSHIETGQELGQAILSRFPLTEHRFTLLPNPNLRHTLPDGQVWDSHDKGVSRCKLELSPHQMLDVATLHMVPFRCFNTDAFNPAFTPIREAITKLTTPTEDLWLLQGDFNVHEASLRSYLPELFTHDDVDEFVLPEATTPHNGLYDHILFKKMRLVSAHIIKDVPTDHYPILCDFEIT